MKILNIGENKTLHFWLGTFSRVSSRILVTGTKIGPKKTKWNEYENDFAGQVLAIFIHLPKLRLWSKPVNYVRTVHKMHCDSTYNCNPLLKNFIILQPVDMYNKENQKVCLVFYTAQTDKIPVKCTSHLHHGRSLKSCRIMKLSSEMFTHIL